NGRHARTRRASLRPVIELEVVRDRAASNGRELPAPSFLARDFEDKQMVAWAYAVYVFPWADVVDVHDRCATRGIPRVEQRSSRLVRFDREANDALFQRREIALDLSALLRIDIGDRGQVLRVRIDGFAITLELHRAQAEVSEHLRRVRELVRSLELAVRVFVS